MYFVQHELSLRGIFLSFEVDDIDALVKRLSKAGFLLANGTKSVAPRRLSAKPGTTGVTDLWTRRERDTFLDAVFPLWLTLNDADLDIYFDGKVTPLTANVVASDADDPPNISLADNADHDGMEMAYHCMDLSKVLPRGQASRVHQHVIRLCVEKGMKGLLLSYLNTYALCFDPATVADLGFPTGSTWADVVAFSRCEGGEAVAAVLALDDCLSADKEDSADGSDHEESILAGDNCGKTSEAFARESPISLALSCQRLQLALSCLAIAPWPLPMTLTKPSQARMESDVIVCGVAMSYNWFSVTESRLVPVLLAFPVLASAFFDVCAPTSDGEKPPCAVDGVAEWVLEAKSPIRSTSRTFFDSTGSSMLLPSYRLATIAWDQGFLHSRHIELAHLLESMMDGLSDDGRRVVEYGLGDGEDDFAGPAAIQSSCGSSAVGRPLTDSVGVLKSSSMLKIERLAELVKVGDLSLGHFEVAGAAFYLKRGQPLRA